MNIRDAQDSWETGRKTWEAFISKKEMEWNAPVVLEQLVMGLSSLPKEVLSQLPPDTARRIKGMLGGTNNGTFAGTNLLKAQHTQGSPPAGQAGKSDGEGFPAPGIEGEGGSPLFG